MRIQSVLNQPQSPVNMQNFCSENDAISSVQENIDKLNVIPAQKINMGSTITIIALALVGCVILSSKGIQKNTGIVLNKLKTYMEGKRDLSSLNAANKKVKFYDFVIKRINSFIKKSESINNINSLKDILFMKLMYKSEPTKQIHKGITNYFEKISRNSVLKSYKHTKKNFELMNEKFDELDNYILKDAPDAIIEYKGNKYTKKELVEMAKDHRGTATLIATNFMSKPSREIRQKYINDVTATLYSRFWDASFKDFGTRDNRFKRKEMWQTFIAAEQIKGSKTKLASSIAFARNALTYNRLDRADSIHNYVRELDRILPPDDVEGIDIIKKLEWFTKNPDGLKDNTDLFKSELNKLREYKIKTKDKNIAKTLEESKESYIKIIEEVLDDDATGEVQDMLSIYYRIAPFELEKSGALFSVKKAVKSFDNSLNIECEDFFDKIRDLRLGSAPTDVLTILFSFIGLTLGVGYTKDNDKRTSMMLRSGIPIAGGIATTTIATTKLVAGGKSIALGILSALALNQLGRLADIIRKNRIVSVNLQNVKPDKS